MFFFCAFSFILLFSSSLPFLLYLVSFHFSQQAVQYSAAAVRPWTTATTDRARQLHSTHAP
jgi:hypothetical protein